MKENIIIVDVVSTGVYFIQDVIDRGYNPIALDPKLTAENSEAAASVGLDKELIKDKCKIIEAFDDYGKTLELVKSYNPIEIIPGSDKGVALSIRLCNDLGLRTNPVESIEAMTIKSEMQLALKKAGVRYILGEIVSSSKEAKKFLDDNDLDCGVVKPLHGAGSQGLSLCDNKKEVIDAVDDLIGKEDIFGDVNDKCLVQEKICGVEFIVNTVSRDGIHRVASIFKYNKSKTEEGGYINNYTESVSIIKPGIHDLVSYAYQTLDAIGIKNGACHGEYMVDNKGPVLIEVNCRPMGLRMPVKFLDGIFGHHETDAVLDAYLDENKFLSDCKKPYKPMRKGFVKLIRVPNDIYVKSLPIKSIIGCMNTVCEARLSSVSVKQLYPKTVDLETHGGIIFMMDKDSDKVAQELYYLCALEHFFFSYLLSDDSTKTAPINIHSLSDASMIKQGNCGGSCLIISDSDESVKNTLTINPEHVKEINNCFDNLILNFKANFEDCSVQQILDLFIECFKKIKYGGKVIISPKTYLFTIYGKIGIEVLMRNCGIAIDVPLQTNPDLLIGTKLDVEFDNIAGVAAYW